MKKEVLRSWREPRIGARLAWRENRFGWWWFPTVALVGVLLASMLKRVPISFSSFALVAICVYVVFWLSSWMWSFASRGVALFPDRVSIYQGRRLDIPYARLAYIEAEEAKEGPAIRLVHESGRAHRIFLSSDVDLAMLEADFRGVAVPWKGLTRR